MNEKTSGYMERTHPADIALEVWAGTLDELFVQAAKGMLELIKPEISGDANFSEKKLSLKEMDNESLLVAFLTDLLFRFEVDRILYQDIDLHITPVGDGQMQLNATLRGKPFYRYNREIKAVTYSGLKIDQTKEGYRATVVFDI
jgi:SHS2 domain-containing protein